jgi:hypothetical protein
MEEWNTGILDIEKTVFNAPPIIPLFHHSNVPSKLVHWRLKPPKS